MTPVLGRRIACNILFGNQPINESDRTVMPDLETLGQIPNRDTIPTGESLDGKQRLVLLRRDAGICRCVLAEAQKPPQRKAECGEGFILRL